VELSAIKDRAFVSVPVALDPRTASLEVRLRRPTTLNPLAWDATGRVEISLVIVVDGVEYRCVGSTSGGIRLAGDGTDAAEYVLRYEPPCGFFGAREGRPRRLGEGAVSYQARVEVRLLRGAAATDVLVMSEALPAPAMPFHSSVAFDAASSAIEAFGDGVISFSHTATGANRAAFMLVGSRGDALTPDPTYAGGGGTPTLITGWDIAGVPFVNMKGYSVVAPATGAQTVTSDLTDTSTSDHFLGVVTMTGVDQTTPVGTAVFDGPGFEASPVSVTVASVGADDLVVDGLVSQAVPTVGADQTSRASQDGSFPSHWRISTQPGTAVGVMSWTYTGGTSRLLGAVAFKQAAAGGAALDEPHYVAAQPRTPEPLVTVW